ncbi:hypothetical protein FIBSPDRAFT_346369 [Athelia psychrophila]|uniref:Uncharacterized protein n=1 Tax=Athelia psychrophila TaxID=1759441 RepID=A0A166PV49_9AGAM|nr:hypothetical protein FIBSPDRAFT_346369 [Fibularhizoctonia sp. CBS 109695]
MGHQCGDPAIGSLHTSYALGTAIRGEWVHFWAPPHHQPSVQLVALASPPSEAPRWRTELGPLHVILLSTTLTMDTRASSLAPAWLQVGLVLRAWEYLAQLAVALIAVGERGGVFVLAKRGELRAYSAAEKKEMGAAFPSAEDAAVRETLACHQLVEGGKTYSSGEDVGDMQVDEFDSP